MAFGGAISYLNQGGTGFQQGQIFNLQTNSATISSGQSVTFNVEFSSVNHFSNSRISLVCQSASNVICTTEGPYASLSDGGTTTLALTLTPPASAAAITPPLANPWRAILVCFGLLLVVPKRTSTWRHRFLNAFLLLGLVCTISACGGGGSSTGGGGGGGGGSSTYSINVVAQATTGSGALQVPAGSITLTVNQ